MKFFIDTGNLQEIREAAEMGADICTVPFKVLNQIFNHPLTDIGLDKFVSDWKQAKG